MKLAATALRELRFPSAPAVAPSGRDAVVVVADVVGSDETDPADGERHAPPRYRTRLWRVAPTGEGALTPLTRGDGDRAPAFAPGGERLAFLRDDADERPQVWVLPLGGGEAYAVTGPEAERRRGAQGRKARAPEGEPRRVERFLWLPDGELLLQHRAGRDAAETDRGLPRRVTTSRFELDGRGLLPEAPAVLERLDLATGRRRVVAEFEFEPAAWCASPAGDAVYVAAPATDRDAADGLATVWRVDLAGGDTRALSERPLAIAELAAAPSGDRLALLAPTDPDAPFGCPFGIWLLPADGGEATLASGDAELAPAIGGDSRYGAQRVAPVWLGDAALLVVCGARGRSGLARLDCAGGRLEPLGDGDRAVTAFHAAGGAAVMIAEAPDAPGEVHGLDLGTEDARPRPLSDLNGAFRARYDLARPEARSCLVPGEPDDRTEAGAASDEDGELEVAYWTLSPTEPRSDGALVLQVHGGPHTAYGYGFYFEFQLLAARGFTVVYGNPRGSTTYGAAFAQAIHGRYGTVDANDVLAIADHALGQHREPNAPLHLTGGSYGGFMTNWLLGETDRFASAVTQRSICNFVNFYGSSDIGPRFSELQLRGVPWGDPDALWRQSPLRRVERFATPLLVIHAEEDLRCPVDQGRQLYRALKRLGKPCELLLVPGEGHELSRSGRPDRREARLDAIVEWFERHTGAASEATRRG